jgi:hypothetical protein
MLRTSAFSTRMEFSITTGLFNDRVRALTTCTAVAVNKPLVIQAEAARGLLSRKTARSAPNGTIFYTQ